MEFTIMQVGSKRRIGGAYRNLHNLFDKHMLKSAKAA